MISETTLAASYASFWRALTPNSERIIRRLNMGADRYYYPIQGASSPDRRGFINEIGFRLFSATHGTGIQSSSEYNAKKSAAVQMARDYVSRLDGVDPTDLTEPTGLEIAEAEEIARSISIFVTQQDSGHSVVRISPPFQGCGIIDACFGDILIDDKLIEVKAGERSFRATDIRQLLVYCALNAISRTYAISHVGCVNPRRGTYFVVDINTLCLELSSESSVQVLSDLTYFASSGDISR
jgi:hypothetical protein